MESTFYSFCSVVINPGEKVKVSLGQNAVWTMTSVAIVIKDDLPKNGRVVLYISKFDENGDIGQKIAIAPLRVCECEVVNIELATFGPLLFTTEGANISVTVSGYTDKPISLTVDNIPN